MTDIERVRAERDEMEAELKRLTAAYRVRCEEIRTLRAEIAALRPRITVLEAAAWNMLRALEVPGPMPETIEDKQVLLAQGFTQMAGAAARLRATLAAPEPTP